MTVPTSSAWYGELQGFRSLGSETAKADSLAGLHEARAAHLSQFWTPTPVAARMWSIAEPAMHRALAQQPGSKIALFDSSIGSGRLVQFADPVRHTIAGIDVHKPALDALGAALSTAGFEHDLLHADIADVRPERFNLALINPPFSIQLVSPHLKPYSCTAFGRFGPGTSAPSHRYALHQALDAAEIVIALVPATTAESAAADPEGAGRLAAILWLPDDAFASENATVSTAILVYDSKPRTSNVLVVPASDWARPLPDLNLRCGTRWSSRPAKLLRCGVDASAPTITRPVTGNRSVRVIRNGKRLRLRFQCGLTQAKVENAVLRRQIDTASGDQHRYPDGVTTVGQGLLDVEILLMQENPAAAFEELLEIIRRHGGEPVPDGGILPYLRRRARQIAIARTPLRHAVYVPAGGDLGALIARSGTVTAKARKTHALIPNQWGSPVVRAGDAISFAIDPDGSYVHTAGRHVARLQRAELLARFDVTETQAAEGQWVQRAEGRAAAFPDQAAHLARVARRLGLDQWLTWDFQFADLIELSMTPGGVIAGHQMGLGKARLALALAMLGQGRHNLIVLEAQLVPEFIAEIRSLRIDAAEWQVIDSIDATRRLRRVNLISYARLRRPLAPGSPSTYARRLRGRIHTLLADEAHAVGNEDTQQVQALYQVAAKRRYGLTGTPCGNYPRSLLPLVQWVAGDGTAAQEYGRRRPYLKPELVRSMLFCQRGTDAFRERFVTTEWITAEWADSMTSGAKREVPSLASIDAFREYAGRFVLRRVWEEPEVARHIQIPAPILETLEAPWLDAHLAMYLETAESFAAWWVAQRERAGADVQRINLVSVLARIGAVFRAANNPQDLDGPSGRYTGQTSKQQLLIDLLARNDAEGRKTIVFATSPAVLQRASMQLTRLGIESVLYTGKVPLAQRTRALNERFRHGNCSTLLASFGVGQTGLNLPQCSDEIFYNRCWSPRQELQALYRALRPGQTRSVRVRYLHLPGSLDAYMARMVDMKSDAARSGLDWGTPEFTGGDFVHWCTILDAFCKDIAALRGLHRGTLRERLTHAA